MTNSTATAKQIRQSTNLLFDEKEHIGPALGPSVERYVRKQRNRILQEQMSRVEMTGKTEVQILRVLCEANASRTNHIAQR